MEVRFHPEATAELEASADWYSERSPKAAREFCVAVDAALAQIVDNPKRFFAIDARHRACNVKKFPFQIVSLIVVLVLYVLVHGSIVSQMPCCRAARSAIAGLHPNWRVWTALDSVRSREESRTVVAVYYEAPGGYLTPPRYVLVAMDASLSFIECLPVTPDSPYYISGRK